MLTNLNAFVNHPTVKNIFTGGYLSEDLNEGDRVLAGATGCRGNYTYEKSYFDIGELNSYGVIDSPEQFREKFEPLLANHSSQITVFFYHVEKYPENKGNRGGWRWHKWGPYLGDGNPEYEYLDDEDGFDEGVYVFHMYLVDGVNDQPFFYFDVESSLDCDDGEKWTWIHRYAFNDLDKMRKECARIGKLSHCRILPRDDGHNS